MKSALARIAIIGVLLLAAAGAGVWWWIGQSGSSQVEEWIRSYLVRAVQGYLKPTLEIGDLDYQYPRTVVIRRLRLVNYDEQHGEEVILAAESARIELAEVPQRGKPIVLQRVELVSPAVHLRRTAAGLAGWSDLLRSDAAAEPKTTEPGYRVSDFLRLTRASVRNAEITYDAGDGSPPMKLAGIDAAVDAAPQDDAPGAYALKAELIRTGLLSLKLSATLDIDETFLAVDAIDLQVEVGRTNYELFPPAVQRAFEAYEVHGRLGAKGDLRVGAKVSLSAEFEIALRDAHFAPVGPVPRLDAQVGVEANSAKGSGAAELLGGIIHFSLQPEDDGRQLKLATTFEQIDAARLIAALPQPVRDATREYRLSGVLGGAANVVVDAAERTVIRGDGRVTTDAVSGEVRGARIDLRDVSASAILSAGQIDSEFRAIWKDGVVDARVTVPRTDTAPIQITGSASRVPVDGLIALWDPTAGLVRMNADSGRISLDGTATILRKDAAMLAVNLDLHSDRLAFDIASAPILATAVAGTVRWANEAADWSLRTGVFGGQIEANGKWSAKRPDAFAFSTRLRDLSLGAGWDLLLAAMEPDQPAGIRRLDGDISGRVEGTVQVDRWQDSTLRADLQLRRAQFAFAAEQVTIDSARVDIALERGACALTLDAGIPGGTARWDASIGLAGDQALWMKWKVDGLRLERLREVWARGATRLRGRLQSDGSLRGRLGDLPHSIQGEGHISIQGANFLDMPILGAIFRLIPRGVPLVDPRDRDTGHASFDLTGDRVVVRELRIESPIFRGHGNGSVHYDGRVDVSLRGGPLNKLEGFLGPVGKLAGKISDSLVEYHVGGTVGAPKVGVHPVRRLMP